ncbi:MAG: DUF4126 domain-containing protein [Coraliomargaritaceae bacterium]
MNEIIAIFAGIGLAAACGFRVFVPLFIASLAANSGMDAEFLGGGFNVEALLGEHHWLGSTPVTIALGVATVLEIGSYYIPWLDNLLDSIATPAAVVAGTFISGEMMPQVLDDSALKWVLGAVLGGGSAGLVQTATVITRSASSATTGGLGNPAVSTAELGGAVLTAVLAILVPVVAGLLVVVLVFFAVRAWLRHLRRKRSQIEVG